jgi:urease accessory protein
MTVRSRAPADSAVRPTVFSGHLTLRAASRPDGRTVLAGQSFRAPYHLSKPYWDTASRVLLVQVVNPTAGILQGDQLESVIAVEADAALLVTTPSASRVFKMKDGAAECRQRFHVADHGWLEVMPEPLVPHRGSRYRQITRVDVAKGGSLYWVDQLMPGRIGHGEVWAWESLCLDLDVRVGGTCVLRERLAQTGPELQAMARWAGSGATACFANALLISPGAENESRPTWHADVAALHRGGLWVGISALRAGGWSLKVVSADPVSLRQTLREIRTILARTYPRLTCDPRKV